MSRDTTETMRAVQVPEPGGQFALIEAPKPEPAAGEVRIKVSACGVCHSDTVTKAGFDPRIDYPRIPGHEVVGSIDAVGPEVESWTVGDRVGVGWHGGHCFTCDQCRQGDFKYCANEAIHGVTIDGGYAEYVVVRVETLARVPETLDAVEAAPLLCAGVTTFNPLRHATASMGDIVAIQGIGGLGHLGLQYANAAGYETAAISSTPTKETDARTFGADHFIDASATDPGEGLQALGGADLVLATAPNAKAVSALLPGLGTDGELILVGTPSDKLEIDSVDLIESRGAVRGWASGHARDSQDTLEFSALRDITPTVEVYDLSDAATAFEQMHEGSVRYRAVLTP